MPHQPCDRVCFAVETKMSVGPELALQRHRAPGREFDRRLQSIARCWSYRSSVIASNRLQKPCDLEPSGCSCVGLYAAFCRSQLCHLVTTLAGTLETPARRAMRFLGRDTHRRGRRDGVEIPRPATCTWRTVLRRDGSSARSRRPT